MMEASLRTVASVLDPKGEPPLEFSVLRGVGGIDTESGGQHAVVRRRRPAALHVAEHGDAHVLPGAHAERVANQVAGGAGPRIYALFLLEARLQVRAGPDAFGNTGDVRRAWTVV